MAKKRSGSAEPKKVEAVKDEGVMTSVGELAEERIEDKPKPKKAVPPPPPENRKPRRPVPQDIKLTARQFCRARGYRWERCAGFLHEMKRKHPSPATRDVWGKLWDAFWARPVK